MEPTYEREIALLVAAYKRAVADIQRELDRLDLADLSRINSAAALREVSRILTQLNEESALWAETNIPVAALDGVIRTLVSLNVVDSVEEAQALAKFNRINAHMVTAAVADTQADLLAVTQNVERKVRAAVRKAVGESIRANMAKGVNGRRTISRDILSGMRATLGEAVNTGIIDAAGRRWKPEVYVDMVTRTKMMRTQIEATENEAVARGAYYGVISRHGATDACANYEGKIVKLIADAPGEYPYIGDLPRREIFHPNCKHVISPVRNPDKLAKE